MRLFIVSILFFSSFTFAADIELKNASIHEFVNFVSKKIKKPIVIGADIDSKLTVYSDYENPDQIKNVLFALARSAGYVVIEKTGFISARPYFKTIFSIFAKSERIIGSSLPTLGDR